MDNYIFGIILLNILNAFNLDLNLLSFYMQLNNDIILSIQIQILGKTHKLTVCLCD
jgi:hypothetical protein